MFDLKEIFATQTLPVTIKTLTTEAMIKLHEIVNNLKIIIPIVFLMLIIYFIFRTYKNKLRVEKTHHTLSIDLESGIISQIIQQKNMQKTKCSDECSVVVITYT